MQGELLVLVVWLVVVSGGCRTAVLLQAAAQGTPAPFSSAPLWNDGTYLGVHDLPTPQLIRVAVDVAGGRIVTIRLLEHPAWRAPEEQERLLRLVVASQTTEGHVPRGTGEEAPLSWRPSADAVAGNEQDHLLHAIDDALRKAQAGH